MTNYLNRRRALKAVAIGGLAGAIVGAIVAVRAITADDPATAQAANGNDQWGAIILTIVAGIGALVGAGAGALAGFAVHMLHRESS